jgi:molecular chaperone DnaK (HSP70)
VEELDMAANGYAAETQGRRGSISWNVLIVDFGAGKLDIGVFRMEQDRAVRICGRGEERGGRDIDFALAHHYLDANGIDLKSYDSEPRARIWSHVVEQCRHAKEELSTETETEVGVTIPGTSVRLGSKTLTRAQFDERFAPWFAEIATLVKQTVAASNVKELDDVLLRGGSCKICTLRKRILDLFRHQYRERQHDLLIVQGAIAEAAFRHSPKQPDREPKLSSRTQLHNQNDSLQLEVERLRSELASRTQRLSDEATELHNQKNSLQLEVERLRSELASRSQGPLNEVTQLHHQNALQTEVRRPGLESTKVSRPGRSCDVA